MQILIKKAEVAIIVSDKDVQAAKETIRDKEHYI